MWCQLRRRDTCLSPPLGERVLPGGRRDGPHADTDAPTLTGMQLVTGTEIRQPGFFVGEGKTQRISSEPLAAVVLACAVAFNYVYFVPTVTRGSGLYQSVWRSDVALLNAGTQAAQAELVFHQSGTSRTSRQAIPAGSQVVFGDVVGTLFASNGSGMLEVRSTTPLVVSSRVFNPNMANAPCYAGATLGQNIDAFARQQASRAGQAAYLLQLAQVTGVFRTNIFLANLGDTQAQVRLELSAGNGSKLYEYPTITLASRESRLEVEPFRTKAGQTNMTTGFARVTVLTGDAVVALASVVDSVTQDPTAVFMKQ